MHILYKKIHKNEFSVPIIIKSHNIRNVLGSDPDFANSLDFNKEGFSSENLMKSERWFLKTAVLLFSKHKTAV